MCNTTKRNIADCVKQLSKKKAIEKITVQDIMKETCMSRQSFYYHFKDIYDVLEWIGKHDFQDKVLYVEGEDWDTWVLNLFQTIESNRAFFEKIVNEYSWAKLVNYLRAPISDSLDLFFETNQASLQAMTQTELQLSTEFITSSISYYMLEYLSLRQEYDEDAILRRFGFIKMLLREDPARNLTSLPAKHPVTAKNSVFGVPTVGPVLLTPEMIVSA